MCKQKILFCKKCRKIHEVDWDVKRYICCQSDITSKAKRHQVGGYHDPFKDKVPTVQEYFKFLALIPTNTIGAKK